MSAQDVIQLLRAIPFEPFRLHLSDGTAYDIRYPELAIVEPSKVIVGVPGPEGPNGPVQRSVFCAMRHITRIEHVNGDRLD